MSTDAVPRPNSAFNLEEIDGELLLYHPASTRAIYLNESAALVWQLCDSSRSTKEIVALLEENYPESDDIRDDVEKTLQDLAAAGAIELDDDQ